jgi:glycosyltransferase involved in cell wall biosynthesis
MLRDRGYDVAVLTGFPNYPDGVIPEPYRGRLLQRESLDGIHIVRSAVYPAPNRGFSRRLLNHASLATTSVLAAPAAGRADVVIAETPPLFTAAAGVIIAAAKRAPLVLNVADLWPESAVQLGALRSPIAIRLAEVLERGSYRRASAVTVPTPGMRETLLRRGEPPAKVRLLPNAVQIDRFRPARRVRGEVARVIYCGTVGMAQGVGTLVEAAHRLAVDGDRIEVLIVGDGAERRDLEERARVLGLGNVTFTGRAPRDQVPDLIADADVAVMSLRDVPLFRDALPSKLLEYMAAARPVVVAARGQAAELVERQGAGVSCPPEDPAAMAQAIRAVVSDLDAAAEMGRRGRSYVEANLSRSAFVERLASVLADVAPQALPASSGGTATEDAGGPPNRSQL